MLGSIFVVIYCLLTAGSAVYVSDVESIVHPFVTVFYSFLFGTIFYNLFNLKKEKRIFQKTLKNLKTVTKLNITTVFNWLLLFYPLKFIEPTVGISIYVAIRPITTFFLTFKDYSTKKEKLTELFFCLIIAFVLMLIIYDDFSRITDSTSELINIFLVVIAAISGSLTSIYAFDLSKKNFVTSQVLSVRFILLIISSLILAFVNSYTIYITEPTFLRLLVVTIISVVLPMYFLQKGLENVGPMLVAYLIPFIPIFTCLIQIFYFHEKVRYFELSLIIFLAISIFFLVFFKKRPANGQKRNSKNT